MTPQRAKVRRSWFFRNAISSVGPSRSLCADAREPGIEQRGYVGGRHGTIGDAPLGRGDLDHGFQPEQAPAAIAHDTDTRTSLLGLGSKSDGDLVGADGAGGGVLRNIDVDGRAHAGVLALLAARAADIDASLGLADQLAVEHHGWCEGAIAQAVRRFERDRTIRRRLTESGAKSLRQGRRQALAAHGLAGLGAAEFQHMAASRLGAEVVVERPYTINLGARQVERLGDGGQGGVGHMAQRPLQIVENLDQRAGRVGMGLTDLPGGGRHIIAWLRHGDPLSGVGFLAKPCPSPWGRSNRLPVLFHRGIQWPAAVTAARP